jgi:DNA-binding response OmpR family regulator
MVKFRNQTILIIDDDAVTAVGVAELLQGEGYGTLVAHDGAEGLDIAEEQHPDLILLDVRMPALDGYEVLTQLAARRVPTRVIVYSGQEKDSANVVRLMKAGACEYLSKPSSFSEILSYIKRALVIEPTMDVSRGDVQKVQELESRIRRLEYENAGLRNGLQSMLSKQQKQGATDIWILVLTKLLFVATAFGATYLLHASGILPSGAAGVGLPVVLTILLLLPMERVSRFAVKVLKSETDVQIAPDPSNAGPDEQNRITGSGK